MATAPAPKLSVVVPTHETRELTLRCLRSLGPPSAELEVILVDDASSDGTAEAVMAELPHVVVLRQPRAGGFARAANLGLRRTRGETLMVLNSDAEMEPGALAAILAAFDRDERLGALGATLVYPNGHPQWSGGREPTLLWLFVLATGAASAAQRLSAYRKARRLAGRSVEWVSGAALALRRRAWEEAGPFDEQYAFYAQDMDLCSRLRERGWRVAVAPDVHVRHHGGATIGTREGAAGARVHPGLLWKDLVRFVAKRRGPAAARRARWALRAGARLRLLARGLVLPLVPRSQRLRWRRDTQAYRDGLRSLTSAEDQGAAPTDL